MTTIGLAQDAPAAGVQINEQFVRNDTRPPNELALGTRHKRSRNETAEDDTQKTITELLGNDVMFPSVGSRNLDLYSGAPHTMTGIPYAIQGSAKVLSVEVGSYLAKFNDPIKAILSTQVHLESRVLITRKYVVGGRSMIVPEHAPARTVAIQEDVREVNMTRYGGDVEMNLNLFLRPADAKEELDLKINAQKLELERTLVSEGYATLMREGTDLVTAIMRSSPLYSAHEGTSNREAALAAERINVQQVFGAMSKHPYPVQNLLAAARYASAYTTSNEKGSVLLLPHGVPDILRYTRQENMSYEISGPALQSTIKQNLTMQIEDAYKDPSSSVRILIHKPLPSFEYGTANPDVGMGGMTDEVSFGNFYVPDKNGGSVFITDLVDGAVKKVELDKFTEDYIKQNIDELFPTAADRADFGSVFVSDTLTNLYAKLNGDENLKPEAGRYDNTDLFTNNTFKNRTAAETNTPGVTAKAMEIKSFVANYFLNKGGPTARGKQFTLLSQLIFQKEVDVDLPGMINTIKNLVGYETRSKKLAEFLFAVHQRESGTTGRTQVVIRPRVVAVMSSAILAAPGEDTGSLLVGYPFTSVSTSSQEVVKIQLRVYMGSVLKKPENVIILRDVYFEGLKEGHKDMIGNWTDTNSDLAIISLPNAYLASNPNTIDFEDFIEGGKSPDPYTQMQLAAAGMLTTDMKSFVDKDLGNGRTGFPARLYRGTQYLDEKGEVTFRNCGHLGHLDHYGHISRLFGAAFVYSSNPDPKNH